jgi:hypothetical protein
LEKLVVEPKTLGLGTLSGKISKMFFENLGVVNYSTEMFSNGFVNMELDMGVKELVVI